MKQHTHLTNSKKALSLGAKMKTGLGGGLVLLALAGLVVIGTLGAFETELHTARLVDGKKLKLVGDLDAGVAKMLGMEKAIVLRAMTGDFTKLEANKTVFTASSERVRRDLDELRPLLASEQGRRLASNLGDSLQAWLPLHNQLTEISPTDSAGALRLHDLRILPIANAMVAASEEFAA